MKLRVVLALACAWLAAGLAAWAEPAGASGQAARPPTQAMRSPLTPAAAAEARLIAIYRLIASNQLPAATALAERLVKDHPHFALAQLVYGDLLSARMRPIRTPGDVPAPLAPQAAQALADLRAESALRLRALAERPAPDSVPAAFVRLAAEHRHAIAIDASRARLYWFENRDGRLTLIDDFYISVGKLGVDKVSEGDQRTPLGVYFITSQLDSRGLRDFYGAGALPLNYPNMLDRRRGKTGSGIWLHGAPPDQYARAPQASDGCVVLANPDLRRLLRSVAIGTPVVIARQLTWRSARTPAPAPADFEARLQDWRQAKASGDTARLSGFYAPDFHDGSRNLAQWLPILHQEQQRLAGRAPALKRLTLLHWQDSEDVMVAEFGEVPAGRVQGVHKRQYWLRHRGQWRIFYEGKR